MRRSISFKVKNNTDQTSIILFDALKQIMNGGKIDNDVTTELPDLPYADIVWRIALGDTLDVAVVQVWPEGSMVLSKDLQIVSHKLDIFGNITYHAMNILVEQAVKNEYNQSERGWSRVPFVIDKFSQVYIKNADPNSEYVVNMFCKEK